MRYLLGTTAILGLATGLATLLPARAADAQSVLGRNPIGSSQSLSTRPVPQAPVTPVPESVWVPTRRVHIPNGGDVLVPGHYERVISPAQVAVPPLVIQTPEGRTTTIPAGERVPVDQRIGP